MGMALLSLNTFDRRMEYVGRAIFLSRMRNLPCTRESPTEREPCGAAGPTPGSRPREAARLRHAAPSGSKEDGNVALN